jgi:hypothetical protein
MNVEKSQRSRNRPSRILEVHKVQPDRERSWFLQDEVVSGKPQTAGEGRFYHDCNTEIDERTDISTRAVKTKLQTVHF